MSLTVRVRVGMGIAVVVGLGGFTGLLAQWGLRDATTRLDRLHAAAEARNEAALISRAVSEARRLEIAFVYNRDKEAPGAVQDLVNETGRSCGELANLLDGAEAKANVSQIEAKLRDWSSIFKGLVETAAKRGFGAGEGEVAGIVKALAETEQGIAALGDEGVRDDMLLARMEALLTSASRDKLTREQHKKKFDASSAVLVDRLHQLKVDAKVNVEKSAAVETSWTAYRDGFDRVVGFDGQIAAAEDDLKRIAHDLEDMVTRVAGIAQQRLDADTKAIRDQNSETVWRVLVGSIVNGILAIVLGAYTIHDLNKRLSQIAHGLNDGADDLHAAATSVATTATRLSDRTAQQASQLEETSASIEELTATTRQNADNASSAAGLAQKARRAAEQGNASMGELDGAMREIQDSAARIAKIIEVIKEIAFQTNLLALNAAVEAARAGEHGRGFAVVAEEVRSLAQRAAASAKETSGIIGASVQTAEKGGRIVDGVVQGQKQIVEDVQSVARLMEEIAAASREQAEGVGQINQAVVTIDKLTQKNASAAETSAAAAEELTGQAASVSSLVGSLVELVQGQAPARAAVVVKRREAPKAKAPPRGKPRVAVEGEDDGEVPSLTEEELKDF